MRRYFPIVAVLAIFALAPAVNARPLNAKAAARHAAIYGQLSHLFFISDGHGRRVLYDFFDPNCPYCHALYEHLRPLLKPYGVTLREIPIAYLRPTSEEKAAALVQSPHPLMTFTRGMAGYSWKSGSAIAPAIPSTATRHILARNLAVDKEVAGFPLVPVLVYKKADGTIRMIDTGAPPAWALKQILTSIARS